MVTCHDKLASHIPLMERKAATPVNRESIQRYRRKGPVPTGKDGWHEMSDP